MATPAEAAKADASDWHPLSPQPTPPAHSYFDPALLASSSANPRASANAPSALSEPVHRPALFSDDTLLPAPRPTTSAASLALNAQRKVSTSKPLFEDEDEAVKPSTAFTWSLPQAPHLLATSDLEQRLSVLARDLASEEPRAKRRAVSGSSGTSALDDGQMHVPANIVARLVSALSSELERRDAVQRKVDASRTAQVAALRSIIKHDAMGVSDATVERALLRADASVEDEAAHSPPLERVIRWHLTVSDVDPPDQPSPSSSSISLPIEDTHLGLDLQDAMADDSLARDASITVEPASPPTTAKPGHRDRHTSVSARLFAGLGAGHRPAGRSASPAPSTESKEGTAPSPPATPVPTARTRATRSESVASQGSEGGAGRSAPSGWFGWAKKDTQRTSLAGTADVPSRTSIAAESSGMPRVQTDPLPRSSAEFDDLATPVASRLLPTASTDAAKQASNKSPSSSVSSDYAETSVSSRPTTAATTGEQASPVSTTEAEGRSTRPASVHSTDQTRPLHSAVSAVLSKRQLNSPTVVATHASPISHPASQISSPIVATFSATSTTGSLPLPHPTHYVAIGTAAQKWTHTGAKEELPPSLLQRPRKVSPEVRTRTAQLLSSLHERKVAQGKPTELADALLDDASSVDDAESTDNTLEPASPSPPPVKIKPNGYLKTAKGTLGRALGLTPGPARPRHSSSKRIEPSLTLPGVVVNRPGQVFQSLVAASSAPPPPSGPVSMELDTIVKPEAKPTKFGEFDSDELVTDRFGFVIDVGSGMRTLRELRQRNRSRLPVPDPEPVADAVRSAIGPSPAATPSLGSDKPLEPSAVPAPPEETATIKATSTKLLAAQLAEMNDLHERALRDAWDQLIRRRQRVAKPSSTGTTGTMAKEGKSGAASLAQPSETCEDIGFTEALIGIAAIGREGKNGQEDFRAFRALMKAGVPQAYRPAIWMEVAGVREKREPGLYEELLASHGDDRNNACAKQIEADVGRTFGSNIYFGGEGPFVDKLRRVLTAFSWHVPEVGYCQGMNMLAGTLLLIYPSEEDAFWQLVVLITVILPSGYFSPTLETVIADQAVMADLLRIKLPVIEAHLEAKGVQIAAFSLSWFLSLFTVAFPIQTLLRVWDLILCDGALVLFRITLAMLSMHQQEILACDDDTALMNYLKELPTQLHQADKLIRIATTDFKSVKSKDIIPLRETYLGRALR